MISHKNQVFLSKPNQRIIWLKWGFLSFKYNKSLVNYLVMPLKDWTSSCLCIAYICQISMSNCLYWKKSIVPKKKKKVNWQVKFLLIHNNLCMDCPKASLLCKEIPMTRPVLISGELCFWGLDQYTRCLGLELKNIPHAGEQISSHLPLTPQLCLFPMFLAS